MDKYTKLKYRETKEKSISEYQSQFTIQPLERGLGNTIGVALRRTLLSSISGIAPFAIRIANVRHEFETLPGVVEDITRLILNVRKLNFSYNPELFKDGDIVKVTFKADKAGRQTYTGDDLTITGEGGVQVVNRETEIATADKGKLEFELFLTSGRGFKSFEENKELVEEKSAKLATSNSAFQTAKIIAVDSDFSPIKNVSISVEELNSASVKIEEKLTVDITTNNTVTAKDVLSQAAQILIAHFQVIGNVENLEEIDVFATESTKVTESTSNSLELSELNLSPRSSNSLRRHGITTINQLTQMTFEELKQVKNLGALSTKEIVDKLKEHGLELQKGEQ
ncbi:DNA-directed RNA polymerase, alpha subunit [Mycoplasmopsis californica]|uniref:DNA-directed RNA polymerase subunit alpha n=1 Tax=Mycoplasmopsis equigenitalium TaxID=114883 RepID=A0ABY5J1I1_9BACT|nr:DNA-directed RNA polymerase subunit alpha [Mycoplasmopsis equigenitalium]UUD37108.1 DNA-directed RNA polymerase subunit alpha [Mycoplasmopsis equigenitalium]VEU69588.1 DNA-directed RNA polymerase, alpha subunit [Mycoplasmopsis californica]